jgi:hypothetical protein
LEDEMDGNAISGALARMTIVLVAVAFAIGAFAMWGLPKLWELAKPLIHAVTA